MDRVLDHRAARNVTNDFREYERRSTIQALPNAAYPALWSSVMIRICHVLVAIALIIMNPSTVRIVDDEEAYA